MPSGDVALFIATPGASNIQPRIDGALDAIKKSGKSITPHTVATGAAVPAELSVIDAYAQGHPDTKGYFAVDAGSMARPPPCSASSGPPTRPATSSRS